MTGQFVIKVFTRQQPQPVFTDRFDGPVELGRQLNTDETLHEARKLADRWRVVVADLREDTMSRHHVFIEPLGGGRVRLTNLSDRQVVECTRHGSLDRKAVRDCDLPVEMRLGRQTVVRVEGPHQETQSIELQALGEVTTPPGFKADVSSRLINLAAPNRGVDVEQLVHWLQATMDVLHSAANSSDFLSKAAQALVDHVGLHSSRLLLYKDGEWQTRAVAGGGTRGDPGFMPSQKVLARILADKRTVWQEPKMADDQAVSLIGVKAVVAAPILNRQGAVIGALYGDRRQDIRNGQNPPITRIHALLVELIASSVAAGLARLEQEQVALAAQVQFEQFFTPELAQQLALQPDLLKGRDCEVTILFCDIRRFSRMSEKLGPAVTVEWMQDVMEKLSECVLAQRGVLVDYIGDEMMAMWGAPESQPDHASRACRAALAMIARLPELNERWQPTLGEPMDLGIGINTGQARVGNTGTQRKFKYGPMGNTVNLASRVQGATKYLKSSCLITGSTQQQLTGEFLARRLGKVAVVNINAPVDLYELVPSEQQDWSMMQSGYEQALAAYEQGDFRTTVKLLNHLLMSAPGDSPALLLLARALNCVLEDPTDFDPVLRLPGK